MTASTVDQAAEAVRAVQPRLADLEAQFRSINILGNQPLAGAADMVAGISAGITGLDVRLDQIGASLADNEDALAQNQRSLTALGVRVGALADRLRDRRHRPGSRRRPGDRHDHVARVRRVDGRPGGRGARARLVAAP